LRFCYVNFTASVPQRIVRTRHDTNVRFIRIGPGPLLVLRLSPTCRLRCFPPYAQEKFVSVSSAIPGHGRKLFSMPLHRQLRSNGNGRSNADTGPRRRGILERCRSQTGLSGGVFPTYLRPRPQCRTRFVGTLPHVICIGTWSQEFSYQRLPFSRLKSSLIFFAEL